MSEMPETVWIGMSHKRTMRGAFKTEEAAWNNEHEWRSKNFPPGMVGQYFSAAHVAAAVAEERARIPVAALLDCLGYIEDDNPEPILRKWQIATEWLDTLAAPRGDLEGTQSGDAVLRNNRTTEYQRGVDVERESWIKASRKIAIEICAEWNIDSEHVSRMAAYIRDDAMRGDSEGRDA